MKKRGLSPVVATVLLISIVIVIGLIVFLWFRGISEEAITKFDGTNVKLVCEEVRFSADYHNGIVDAKNDGDVPIYALKAKVTTDGGYSTHLLENSEINQGGAYSGTVEDVLAGDTILLIPVLVGETSEGQATYTCDERHGIELDA